MRRAIRSTLRALRREFLRAADRHPDLFYEVLEVDWSSTARPLVPVGKQCGDTEEEEPTHEDRLRKFIEVNADRPKRPSWEMWDASIPMSWGHFFGTINGLETFQRLAESLAITLKEDDPQFLGRSVQVDSGLAISPHYIHAVEWMIGLARLYPTPLLRLKSRMWDEEDGPLVTERFEMWERNTKGYGLYPLHPYCERFAHNVFLSAAAAIALFLEPANALILYDESDSASAHFWDDVRSLGRLDPCATEPEPSSIDNAPYVFLRQGDIWTLRFTTESGVEQNPFTNSPGFVMYHTLLENPGKRMEALDVDPHTRPVEESGLPMADKKAIAQTLQRKKELEDQQAIAEATRDHVTAAEAGHELRDIEKYLAEVSFAGRAKSARPRNARLAHTNIKTAFSRTRKRIASEGMPQLAAYLEEQVKPEAGQGWRYTPSEGVQWLTKLEEADSHDEQQSVESDTPPF